MKKLFIILFLLFNIGLQAQFWMYNPAGDHPHPTYCSRFNVLYNWQSVAGATQYQVFVRTVSNVPVIDVWTTNTWISLPYPNAVGEYFAVVFAYNSQGQAISSSYAQYFALVPEPVPTFNSVSASINEQETKPYHQVLTSASWNSNGATIKESGFVINGSYYSTDLPTINPSYHLGQLLDTENGTTYTIQPYLRWGESWIFEWGSIITVTGGYINPNQE